MNASYKIALVVAVGLLILVAGYYATRNDAPAPTANDVSNAPGEAAFAAAGDTSTSQPPQGEALNERAGRTAPPNHPPAQPEPGPQPVADDSEFRHVRLDDGTSVVLRPDETVAEPDPSPQPDPQPAQSPPAVVIGPPPAALPGSLEEARNSGITETPLTDADESSPPAREPAEEPIADSQPTEEPDTTPAVRQPEPDAQPERPTRTTDNSNRIPATYTVAAGDMLVTIAERFYGTQTAWEAIAQANPTVDPTRLRVGQELRMPRLDAVERPRTQAPPPNPGRRDTYTVQAGDNLYRIAEQFYDDAEKWDVIYNHNRDAIGADPAKLNLGMTLIIPPAVNGAD